MTSVSDRRKESAQGSAEDSSARCSRFDEHHGIPTSHQGLDSSSHFANFPFDEVFLQGFRDFELYLFNVGYGPPSTPLPSPSVYSTRTSMPTGTSQDFLIRTGTHTQVQALMNIRLHGTANPSASSINESCSFAPQLTSSIGSMPSEGIDPSPKGPMQTVRGSQLEKVGNSDFRHFPGH